MYGMISTRPDVAFALSVVSRYQSNLGLPHGKAVKDILKYLRRTNKLFLVYGGVIEQNLHCEILNKNMVLYVQKLIASAQCQVIV